MSSARERAATKVVFATLCRVRFAREFWRSALMSMVLGVFSTLLILMDRVLDLRVFTDLQKRENLGRKKKKEKRKSFLLAIIFT
jgi:hypothetical protein